MKIKVTYYSGDVFYVQVFTPEEFEYEPGVFEIPKQGVFDKKDANVIGLVETLGQSDECPYHFLVHGFERVEVEHIYDTSAMLEKAKQRIENLSREELLNDLLSVGFTEPEIFGED